MKNHMNRDDYLRSLIKDRLAKIKMNNPSYSQRSHARDLGLSASSYNQFLSDKRNLSEDLIDKIFDKIKLEEYEKEFYYSLAYSKDCLRQEKVEFAIDREAFKIKIKFKICTQQEGVMESILGSVEKISKSIEKLIDDNTSLK